VHPQSNVLISLISYPLANKDEADSVSKRRPLNTSRRGNNPKDNTQHLEQGETFKSRKNKYFSSNTGLVNLPNM
jgi:hypothetical protein